MIRATKATISKSLRSRGLFLGVLVGALASMAWFLSTREASSRAVNEEGLAHSHREVLNIALAREGKHTALMIAPVRQQRPEDFLMILPVSSGMKKARFTALPHDTLDVLTNFMKPRAAVYRQHARCPRPHNSGFSKIAARQQQREKRHPLAKYRRPELKPRRLFDYAFTTLEVDHVDQVRTWLEQNNHSIPANLNERLQPAIDREDAILIVTTYVSEVQAEHWKDEVLPVLHLEDEREDFSLPLGGLVVSAGGASDLRITVFSKEGRQRIVGRPDVVMPTDVQVDGIGDENVERFHDAMIEEQFAQTPGASLTEVVAVHDWELEHFGPDTSAHNDDTREDKPWTLTRLRVRLSEGEHLDTLHFETAPALRGGSGEPVGLLGGFATSKTEPNEESDFSVRYVDLERWDGDVSCFPPRLGWEQVSR